MAGGGLNIDDRAGKWAVGMEICCRHRHGRASLRVVVAVSPETERRHHIPFRCWVGFEWWNDHDHIVQDGLDSLRTERGRRKRITSSSLVVHGQ